MLFQHHWDEKLLTAHKEIESDLGHKKVIISYFGQMWQRDEAGSILGYDQSSGAEGRAMAYSEDHRSFGLPINTGHPRGAELWTETDKNYLEHYNIQGGYLFTRSSFLLDVGYDPQLMFFGEELLLAMRSWTRGYQIFAIKPPIQWHKDRWSSVKHDIERDVIEDTQRPPSTPEGVLWDNRQASSMKRVQSIFKGEILGHWGSPDLASLNKYLEVSSLGSKMNLIEFNPYTGDLI
jgi:hypothetical protein